MIDGWSSAVEDMIDGWSSAVVDMIDGGSSAVVDMIDGWSSAVEGFTVVVYSWNIVCRNYWALLLRGPLKKPN